MKGDRIEIIRSFALHLCEQGVRLLFPPLCSGCVQQVSSLGTVCGSCWMRLRFIEPPYCRVMGIPFAHDLDENVLSAEAIAQPPPFHRMRAAVAHDDLARRMVVALKYHDRIDLAPWMARWMIRVGHELIADCDVIVPIPLHRFRFWSRRFNQAAELARAIACQTKNVEQIV